jgi:two-component system alkaline phosphatase synthesis response regulator PhoP
MHGRERALVVEGSRSVAAGLERALSAAGFDVRIAPDAERARAMFAELRPDVVVLDVVLPGRCDGWTLLRTLRHAEDAVPVLVLSAAAAERDKVRGLRLGADDYMAKPIGARELVARVEAVMRRARAPRLALGARSGTTAARPRDEALQVADVEIDVGARSVRRHGATVTLTPTEFDVLLHLVRRRGHVVTQSELLRAAFARDHHAGSRTVVMHVSALRRKLGDDAASPRVIHTVWGRGYRVGG